MHAPEPPKPFLIRLQERLAASRFLTFSVLLHAVLVLLGGSVVLFKHYVPAPDFEASGGGLVSGDVAEQSAPEQPPDLSQQTFAPQAPQLNAPTISAIQTTNVSTPTFQVAAALPVMQAMPNDAMEKALTNVAKTAGVKGLAGNLPSTMGGRAGGTARGSAMMKNGGKQASEEAVMRGLRWLVKTQNPDGTWSKQHIPAMTGLAILCFLGHGETPVSPEFGPTVQKAIDWLLTQGTKYDGRLNMEKAFSQPGVYTHGIVAYALGEYYTMTKDERAVELLKKSTKHIVDGQGPDGGWMYSFDKSQSDTSVSGWQIQALKAAHLSGLNIEGVDSSLDKAMLNLQRVRGKNGGFGYRKPEDKYSLTGVGVLCTHFWKPKDKSVGQGVDFIIDQTEKNFPVQYMHEKADLYAWYYHTQACLMAGGGAWTKWNRYFQDTIVKAQSPDGSWPVMTAPAHGAIQNAADKAGPYYRTTLCILMLEVYYRYMPSTK